MPFKKGQSGCPEKIFKPGEEWKGSPGGRPKGLSITAEVNKLLQEDPEGKIKRKKKKARLLAEGIFISAVKGNSKAAEMIWNRVDGAVKQEIGGSLDLNLNVINAASEEFQQFLLRILDGRATQGTPKDESRSESDSAV